MVDKLEFELLESEEISDFDTVTQFIREVKELDVLLELMTLVQGTQTLICLRT